jgi:5,6-dimethylbenzimidazole synthase
MKIDEFTELVHKRRSIRRLKPDPIPDEWVEKILECARWAMSGGNAQPWEFIVIKDKNMKLNMAQAWLECWREYKVMEMTRVPEMRHPLFLRPDDLPNWKEAPVIIAVCGDRRKMQATVLHANFYGAEGGGSGTDATFLKDMANPCQIMHLAAASLGLGSHWLSIERDLEQKFKSLLNVPEVIEVHSLVVLGYPAYEPPPGYRRELQEIVHYETYDRSKVSTNEDILKHMLAVRDAVKSQENAAYKLKTWKK